MIAAAYLVLTLCAGGYACGKDVRRPITAVTIPQPSMDQCIRQANAFNQHRKNTRAMCVKGSEK